MYLYYENSLLNKLIISLAKPFSNLESEYICSYDKFEDIDIRKIIESIPNDDLVFLSSSFIETLVLESKIPEETPLKITFIIRDAEEIETDTYSILNWYIYWTNMQNNLHDEEIDKELIDTVYSYFYKLPSLTERRIVEYLTSLLQLPNKRFVEILKNETISMIMTRGKTYLEQKNREIEKDKNNSTTKIIKEIRCSLCISNYLETAFQILDKTNVEAVLLFDINLRTASVDIVVVPRDSNKSPFSHLTRYRNGFMNGFRMTFKEFVDLLG